MGDGCIMGLGILRSFEGHEALVSLCVSHMFLAG
jgi:hypothetical protein